MREPVILMGETGCGKTYLVKFISEALFGRKAKFHQFTFHFGIREREFQEFMGQVLADAIQNEDEMQWVFFDEFNTSSLQPFVTELLIDRVFSLESSDSQDFHIPDNVYFVAACNPYQFKNLSQENKNDIVKVHPSKQNLLSHKVLPISSNLLYKIFDYGSLTPQIERKYVENIFKQLRPPSGVQGLKRKTEQQVSRKHISVLCEFVCEGQAEMKRFFNSQSAVSLRDVNRVKQVLLFFLHFVQYRKQRAESPQESFDQFRVSNRVGLGSVSSEDFLAALSVTMHLNYIFRLGLTSTLLVPLTFRTQTRIYFKFGRNHPKLQFQNRNSEFLKKQHRSGGKKAD